MTTTKKTINTKNAKGKKNKKAPAALPTGDFRMLCSRSGMNEQSRRPFDARIEPPESPTYQAGF